MDVTGLDIPRVSLNDPSVKLPVDLLAIIQTSLHEFLPASSSLHEAAVLAAKKLLDPVAEDVHVTHDGKRIERRRKRKRGQYDQGQILQIQKIYTDGFGVNQVWEQVKRVTDAAAQEVQGDLERLQPRVQESGQDLNGPERNGHDPIKIVQFDEEGFEVDSKESLNGVDAIPDMSQDEADDFHGENIENDAEVALEDIEEDEDADILSEDETHVERFVPDPNNLNDGFFSIDDFNKQSQFLEQKDARGEDDNPSDEDEIDWDADPLSMPFPKSKRDKVEGEDATEDDEDDDGPTFGDLDAPSEDEPNDDADMGDDVPGLGNTNEILYADFFEPPPKKPSKTKRMRALPKTQPAPQQAAALTEAVESDIQRAMADVRRDLLDSEEEISDEEDSASGEDRPKTEKKPSTHEKQKAAIAAEIRKLEAAAVAKREWTLSGEARAADRPINSLIEEDLDFEPAGKPVPVVTAEVSEGIEALIKRRIIARDFNEIVRRRPDALGSAKETRRGMVELNDARSKQGLAEIYEQEHLAKSDPNYESTLDKKTKKAHSEIDILWKEVSGQLDVLSNLHFKPKRAEVEIKSVQDKPTIRMEDARPGGAAGEENMLAPQEVFRAGENTVESDVIVRKSGASASKDEMSREEKLRRRRRAKERQKKASVNESIKILGKDDKPRKKSRKEENSNILTDLRKGNVKIIGKKGELQDLSKRPKGSSGEPSSSSAFKL